MGKLEKRIAVITGASTGIGKSIAIAYAGEGAKIVLASRNKDQLETVAQEKRISLGEGVYRKHRRCLSREPVPLEMPDENREAALDPIMTGSRGQAEGESGAARGRRSARFLCKATN